MQDTELIEKIAHLEEREKSNTKRINEHDEQIKELSNVYVALTKVDVKISNVEKDVSEIKETVEKSKEQKGMKWDKLIDYLFYAILAFALFKLRIKIKKEELIMKDKKFLTIISIITMLIVMFSVFVFSDDKELQKEVIEKVTDTVTDIATYEMTDEEIDNLATTEIIEQTEEQENAQEQEIEGEGFELQSEEIAYEGDRARSWNIELGDYKALTYYSQIDSRWSNKMYSSVNDRSQTIGTSGCGPTSAAMVVTACKGAITPDMMSDLFVRYGYRSANNGTYWSAFRAVADEFNIGYTETSDIQRALQLLQNNNYVVCSVGNGLFTTGGHFIVLVGIDGDTIKIYDPYLYSGKFETSTRRGKVTVSGNTVYCSVENFKNYANAKGFFAYAHDGNVVVNNTQTVATANYTRYVNAKSGLNVRNAPNGARISGLVNKTRVTVAETSGSWSRITSPVSGWVSSNYLTSYTTTTIQKTKITGYTTGRYKVTKVSKNSVLNVRYGASTKYSAKTWRQLSTNARSQNGRLGNYYANGYKNGVVFNAIKIVNNEWALTSSGYVNLKYCVKMN